MFGPDAGRLLAFEVFVGRLRSAAVKTVATAKTFGVDHKPSAPTPFDCGTEPGHRTPQYGDRHDVRHTDRERSTSNVQLATFNGGTECVHGDRDMGTDTMFGPARRRWADYAKRIRGAG